MNLSGFGAVYSGELEAEQAQAKLMDEALRRMKLEQELQQQQQLFPLQMQRERALTGYYGRRGAGGADDLLPGAGYGAAPAGTIDTRGFAQVAPTWPDPLAGAAQPYYDSGVAPSITPVPPAAFPSPMFGQGGAYPAVADMAAAGLPPAGRPAGAPGVPPGPPGAGAGAPALSPAPATAPAGGPPAGVAPVAPVGVPQRAETTGFSGENPVTERYIAALDERNRYKKGSKSWNAAEKDVQDAHRDMQAWEKAHVAPKSRLNPDEQTAVADLATGMIEGRISPNVPMGLRLRPFVEAELARRGYNQAQAMMQWKAAEKDTAALHGERMLNFVGLARSLQQAIPEIKRLSNELFTMTGVPKLNKLMLQGWVQTMGNTPQGQLAARYLALTGGVETELARITSGGYAPTSDAWQVTHKLLNAEYGSDEIAAQLDQVNWLLSARLKNIPGLEQGGPGTPNPYLPWSQPSGGATSPATLPATLPAGGMGGTVNGLNWSVR
jgi:hypothetical protein